MPVSPKIGFDFKDRQPRQVKVRSGRNVNNRTRVIKMALKGTIKFVDN